MSNDEIRKGIKRLKNELGLDSFILNPNAQEILNEIKLLQDQCTHTVNSLYCLDEDGNCIFCGRARNQWI